MCPSFEWIQFLDFARASKGMPCTSPTSECHDRTATNRAYYAAYHTAREYIREVDAPYLRSEPKRHATVLDWFGMDHGDAELRTVGRLLKDAFDRRHSADYCAESQSYDGTAREVIWWAEKVIRIIRQKRCT